MASTCVTTGTQCSQTSELTGRTSWFTGEHETTEQLYMKVLGSNHPPQKKRWAEAPEAKAAN